MIVERTPKQENNMKYQNLTRNLTRTAVLAAALFGAANLSAQVRTEIPKEDPGPPFYARIERQAAHTNIAPHTEEWAAVVFYRSPACVPPVTIMMSSIPAWIRHCSG